MGDQQQHTHGMDFAYQEEQQQQQQQQQHLDRSSEIMNPNGLPYNSLVDLGRQQYGNNGGGTKPPPIAMVDSRYGDDNISDFEGNCRGTGGSSKASRQSSSTSYSFNSRKSRNSRNSNSRNSKNRKSRNRNSG